MIFLMVPCFKWAALALPFSLVNLMVKSQFLQLVFNNWHGTVNIARKCGYGTLKVNSKSALKKVVFKWNNGNSSLEHGLMYN